MFQPDITLLRRVHSYSENDCGYWSFKGRSKRENCHALLQYPAMMVPEMQGELIDAVLEADSNVKRLIDPFVGSGTTLGEAMCRGLNFTGIDINPLAILACEVKSGPLHFRVLEKKIEKLLLTIKTDTSEAIEITFNGIDKWFTHKAKVELSKIYRAVRKEQSKWARKIFWLSMSNTVRAVCNSRRSTFKLHIKTTEQINAIPSAINVFEKNVLKSHESIKEQNIILRKSGNLKRNRTSIDYDITHGDSSCETPMIEQCDLLVSSPPYGDNHTTVTYGQYSYLPLQWIDIDDIDNLSVRDMLSTTCVIDSLSLGGSKRGYVHKLEVLKGLSLSLVDTVTLIENSNKNNVKKVVSFLYDLNLALDNSLRYLRNNAYMIWTLGNRRVSNVEVPLDKIMKELLESKGCKFVYQIDREILSKRMAKRNKIASTMEREIILMMRK